MKCFYDLVLKNRSYRRFDNSAKLSDEYMRDLIVAARVTPSAGNRQVLRYRVVNEADECEKVYSTLGWAGYLKDWDGPETAERPSAYIVVLTDAAENGSHDTDVGIAAQTILLKAVYDGFGGCMLGNIKRDRLAEELAIDNVKYRISLVIALGKPVEDVRITDVGADGDIRYYRDDAKVHYVPKRSADELLI